MAVKFDIKDSSTRLLYLFLATDLVFIILHLLFINTDFISNKYFSIEEDRGYAEIFQYIKEYWIVLLLSVLAVKQRSILYLGWSLLFLYVLLDDFFAIHERLGEIVSERLFLLPMFNLRAIDFGEVIVSACVGLFFLLFLALAYRFGSRISREVSKFLILMLFALACFGVAVDMLHSMLRFSSLKDILGLLEDGGEMIIMSVIAWFVFRFSESLYANLNSLKKPEQILEKQYR